MRILGLPTTDSYKVAAATLEHASYRPGGIPQGHNWRTAAKLIDSDLIAGIKIDWDEVADSGQIEY